MNITVGVCTSNPNNPSLLECIQSLDQFGLEVIVASGPEWLPKKKNWIASVATGEYLCIVHDYYKFGGGWLQGNLWHINHYPDADVLVSAVYTKEGRRSADWLVNPNHMLKAIAMFPELDGILRKAAPHENGPQYVAGLPYDTKCLTDIQYISGGYIFCKTDLIRQVPLNEKLVPGDSEDVEWSERIIDHGAKFHFNTGTFIDINKPNKWAVTEMPPEAVTLLRKYNEQRKSNNF